LKRKECINISRATINRFENEIGEFRTPIGRPILSEKNREARINYAKEHLEDKFSNVVFSDESTFS